MKSNGDHRTIPTATLVLGGARSGKSTFACKLVESASQPILIATGQPIDQEMTERIRVHRLERPEHWITHETPIEITKTLAAIESSNVEVVVDCLTLWVSNLMHADKDLGTEFLRLVDAVNRRRNPVVLVSNDVGAGIIPANAMARVYRDQMGRLHQMLATRVDYVYLMVAGIPMTVKAPGICHPGVP